MTALIVGRRRQGKSTLALWLALRMQKPVIIWDPNCQYRLPGYRYLSVYEVSNWLAASGKGIVIVRPEGNLESQFADLSSQLWPWGHYTLLVDECSTLQRAGGMHADLERYIRQAPRDDSINQAGQALSISIIQTTHRMTDTATTCRALATDVFLFCTTLVRDLDAIEDQFGAPVRVEVQRLALHQCIHCYTDAAGAARFSIWEDPSRWYLEAGTNGR